MRDARFCCGCGAARAYMVDELLDARHDVLALRDAKTAAVWVGGALRRKIALHVDHEQRVARRDRADGHRLRSTEKAEVLLEEWTFAAREAAARKLDEVFSLRVRLLRGLLVRLEGNGLRWCAAAAAQPLRAHARAVISHVPSKLPPQR